MSLKDVQRNARQRGLDYEFRFGKWRGFTVKAIIDSGNYGYIQWYMENRDFELINEAHGYLQNFMADDLPF